MAIASAIGLFVALLRIAHIPVLHQFLVAYVEIFRGLPTIVILFLAYFGLPSIGITVSDNPIVVGVVALSFNLAAYLSEVFRAAILAIDPGQMEAALSFGLSRRQGYVRVVLPQALLVAVPTLGSFLIGLLKDTSLLSFISVTSAVSISRDP
jgi:His/Glu/Gln/Arg/opine family amino acid ABC transporter permease subunit